MKSVEFNGLRTVGQRGRWGITEYGAAASSWVRRPSRGNPVHVLTNVPFIRSDYDTGWKKCTLAGNTKLNP